MKQIHLPSTLLKSKLLKGALFHRIAQCNEYSCTFQAGQAGNALEAKYLNLKSTDRWHWQPFINKARHYRKVKIDLCFLRNSLHCFGGNHSLVMCYRVAYFKQNNCIGIGNYLNHILDMLSLVSYLTFQGFFLLFLLSGQQSL